MTADVLFEKISLSEVTHRHIETYANKTNQHTLLKNVNAVDASTKYLPGKVYTSWETKALSSKEANDQIAYREKLLMDVVDPVVTE